MSILFGGVETSIICNVISLIALCLGWLKGDRLILLGYLPFVLLQLLYTSALSNAYGECGKMVSVLTFFVYLTIPVFHCIWINDTLFKWGAEFTKSFRSQGESTERLASSETGERTSDAKKFHDETVAKYVGQRNQMRYVALTCAVAAVAFFLYLNLFGTADTFCVAEGEVFGTISWAFLDVVPIPSAFNFLANWFGTYMHCDGIWWLGNGLRMAMMVVYFFCYAAILACYRGEGDAQIEYKRGFLFQLLLLALVRCRLVTHTIHILHSLITQTKYTATVCSASFSCRGYRNTCSRSQWCVRYCWRYNRFGFEHCLRRPSSEISQDSLHKHSRNSWFGKPQTCIPSTNRFRVSVGE